MSKAVTTAILIALFVLVTACGGRSASPSIPSGWREFKEGAFSGAVRNEWQVSNVFAKDVAQPSDPALAGMPPELRESLAGMFQGGELESIFVVQMYADPSPAALFESFGPCFPAAIEPATKNDRILADSLAAEWGVDSRPSGFVMYRGRSFAVAEVDFAPGIETYIGFLGGKDCFVAILFVSQPGDTRSFEDFRTFVSLLRIDRSSMPVTK